MHCKNFRRMLVHAYGRKELLPEPGRQHLLMCPDCAAYCAESEIEHLIRRVSVDPPTGGFTDRALQQAWQKSYLASCPVSRSTVSSHWSGIVLGLAFLLLLTALQLWRSSHLWAADGDLTTTSDLASHTLTITIFSENDLADATLTVKVSDNVYLDGYRDFRELSWPTSLLAGKNQIKLPVRFTNKYTGEVLLFVQAGEVAKEFLFKLDPESCTERQERIQI